MRKGHPWVRPMRRRRVPAPPRRGSPDSVRVSVYPDSMTRRSPGVSHAFSLLGAFLALSMVMGLLGAGLLIPPVGLAGLSAKQAVGTFDALPAEFTASPMARQSQILANDGSVIASLYEENRVVVPLAQIAPVMQNAQIAIEDARYYEHGGVDPRGIMRALVQTAQGNTQGASTITQQYVRQTLYDTALKSDNKAAAQAVINQRGVAGAVRKLQEMKYAVALEQKLSKQQILEGYLNLVYYGAQAYGVEAASQRYFGVRTAKLSLPQAAMIAGMAQRPGSTDPFNHPDLALARRNEVLQAMYKNHFISQRALNTALKAKIVLNPVLPKASCPASRDPYFCDYVTKWLLDQPGLGATVEARRKLLYRGGLKIQTTFDPKLNQQIKDELTARVPINNSRKVGAAAAVVEPGTGRVVALAQNTQYTIGKPEGWGDTTINYTVDSKYGSGGGFQIGSTAKMFAVVTALKEGYSAYSSFYAPAAGTRYSASAMKGTACGMTASYGPGNAESNEHGQMTLQHATALSVNTAFLQLATMVGLCNTKTTMAEMGMHQANGEPYGSGPAGVILGADNASPLTLAASYATLAAGGTYCTPVPVTAIASYTGQKYSVATGNCKQVIDPKVAYDTTKILQTVLEPGGTGSALGLSDGRPAAGKTGTADESKQTWFAGYTPQRAAAVWVGTPIAQRSLNGVTLGGRSYGSVFGATIAGPLWEDAMNLASKGLPAERFRLKSDGAAQNADVTVPDVTGRSRNSATNRLETAGFTVQVADTKVNSDSVQYNRVARTEPAAGQGAAKGDTVTLYLSRGTYSGNGGNNNNNGNNNNGGGGNTNGGGGTP